MILAAIQHSSTQKDCYCLEPGHFLFRIRTAKSDILRIILHTQDKYLPLKIYDTRCAVPMFLAASDGATDYWEAELSFQVVCLRYWFELIDSSNNTIFYSNYHFSDQPITDTDDMFDCPQNLREEERMITPAWAENKVIYQVFPSRFASSLPIPDSVWYHTPMHFTDNLHGDLRGIIQHLDHIHTLGADILYMTPLFRSNSCHKYDTIDYYQIDPSFGTIDDLKELVNKAHALGMRIVLDGVFNHTAPDFFAFSDIKKHERNSKYINWYFIKDFPLHANWGEKPNYKTFSYFGGMPKLNIMNPEVTQYIIDVALYWLRECQIDGWRLDVGDEISHYFWRKFRTAIKQEFPDALITGEIWHHAEDFLQGDEWDTVMNYPFYQSILRLVATEEISVSQFSENLNFQKGNLHRRVFPLLWNLVDSHDTPRLLHSCGGDKRKMKLAVALQLLLPGMPMIYYGDEYGMDGGQDPDCRRGMLWDPKRQDQDMFLWYQKLLSIRKKYPLLLTNSVTESADNERKLLKREITVEQHTITLLFHCSEGGLALPGYTGKCNLLSGAPFSGTLNSWEPAVILD